MKSLTMNSMHTFPAFLLLLGTAACNITIDEDVLGAKEGDDVREVGTFVNVINRSDADVVLIPDQMGDGVDPGDVVVACDGGIVADVDTDVDGEGNLVIAFAAEVASVLGCEVRIVTDGVEEVVDEGNGDITCEEPMPDVRSIAVKGNGSIDLAGVEADELHLLVTGNGSLTIGDVQVDMLYIDLSGNGDIDLGGETTNADLQLSGSGDLMAQELTVTDTLDALLNGSGNGVITVLGTVNAEVLGEATLEIYGGAEPGQISEVDGGEVVFH